MLEKVFLEYREENQPEPQTESVWAEKLDGSIYRIDNIPFFVYGISYNDVVETELKNGLKSFVKIAKQGGHSTYRIILQKNKTVDDFYKLWEVLGENECTFEGYNSKIIAIDVPPTTNIEIVETQLYKGFIEETWIYERANMEHVTSA